jgi:[ribosomal protein S18]-alanine N-acetyltransferase
MYYFVEPLSEEDIPAVQEIERRSFTTPWSLSTYRQELRNQSSRYLVARASPTLPPPREQRPPAPRSVLADWVSWLLRRPPPAPTPTPTYPLVGYGGVWLSVDEGHITTIATAPEHRGRGIGELLLISLVDQALDLGADRITLEVRVSNTAAQQLYLKYGFEPVGRRPRYYTDNGEDAMLMTTPLIREATYQEQLKRLRDALYDRLRRAADQPAPTHTHASIATPQT